MSSLFGLPRLGFSSQSSSAEDGAERRSSLLFGSVLSPRSPSLSAGSEPLSSLSSLTREVDAGKAPSTATSESLINSSLPSSLAAIPRSNVGILGSIHEVDVGERVESHAASPMAFEAKFESRPGDDTMAEQIRSIRQQVSAFSNEVAQIRSEVKKMSRREETLQAELAAETTHRQDQKESFELSMKSVLGEFEDLRQSIANESNARRETDDSLRRDLAASIDGLSKAVDELRHQQTMNMENSSLDRSKASELEAKVHSIENEFTRLVEAEKAARKESCESLEEELRHMRSALEKEVLNNSKFLKEQSDVLEAHIRGTANVEANVTQVLRKELEAETQARHASDLKTGMRLEELNASIQNKYTEIEGRIDIDRVRADIQREASERTKVQQEHERSHAELVENHRRALEKESARHDEGRIQLDRQLVALAKDLEKQITAQREEMANERKIRNGMAADTEKLLNSKVGDMQRLFREELKAVSDIVNQESKASIKRQEEFASAVKKAEERIEREAQNQTAVMDEHAKNLQKLANIHAESKKTQEESLERGLKAMYQSLEKGLDKEATGREELRLKHEKMVEEISRKQIDENSKGLENLKREVMEHVSKERSEQHDARNDLAAALREVREDGRAKLRESLADVMREFKSGLSEMEEKLRGDLRTLESGHDKKFAAMKDALDTVDRKHVDKHAQNTAMFEKARADANSKLKEELSKMKGGVDGAHGNLRQAMMEVSKQVENQRTDLQKEQKARSQAEERLEKLCNKMKEDIQISLKEAHSALRLELAEQSKQADGMKAAIQDAHAALKAEFKDYQANTERATNDILKKQEQALGEIQDSHGKVVGGLEDKLRDELRRLTDSQEKKYGELNEALNAANEQLSANRDKNAVALEAHIQKMKTIEESLKDDQRRMAAGHENKHAEIKEMLTAVNDNHNEKHAKSAKALDSEISKAMASVHKKLQEEVALLTSGVDGNHSQLREIILGVTQQVEKLEATVEKESKQRLAKEERLDKSCSELRYDIQDVISRALDTTHEKLSVELEALKDAVDGQNGTVLGVLTEVTKRVDTMDDALQAEQKLRFAMEAAIQEGHAALKTELNDHKESSEKATRDLMTKEEQARSEVQDLHTKTISQMEEMLRSDLQRLADSHEKANGELKDALDAANQQHNQRHVQNAAALEDGISGALATTHQKLQDELALLKNGVSADHGSLRDILTQVTQHVESLDETLQKEQKLRLAVEERLEKSCVDLRRETGDALQEAHAALRLELAQHSQNNNEMQVAMQDAHRALKAELDDQKASAEKTTNDIMRKQQQAHGEIQDLHSKALGGLEDKLRDDLRRLADAHEKKHGELSDAMNAANDLHNAKHVQNAAALEDGISDALAITHKKLQEELVALRDVVDGSHGSLREIVMEVTKQVDSIDDSLRTEQKARLAVEERLERSCNDLRHGMEDSLKESHAALRMELASHGKNADEMKAAMAEAHMALKQEMNDHRQGAEKTTRDLIAQEQQERDKHVDTHQKTMKEMEDQLRKDLQKVSDDHTKKHEDMTKRLEATHEHHSEKHAQNAKALEDGILDALDSTHKKLQEEVALLKGGVENGHGSLREVLLEVTKQVDIIDQAVQKEQKARLFVEEKLDKSCNELKKEANDALKESHAALRMELASQSKSGDEMKAAMMEAHKALKDELNDHKVNSAKATRDLIMKEQQARGEAADIHKRTFSELDEKLQNDLKKLADSHDRKHSELRNAMDIANSQHQERHLQNSAAIEDGIASALASTHQKLQEEVSVLKIAIDSSHGNLRDVLVEVTKQVDYVDDTLKREQQARLAVEDRFDKTTIDLRHKVDDAIKESQAALRMELAAHSNNTDEMKTAMQEAHRALKQEMSDHRQGAEKTTRDLIAKEQQARDNHAETNQKTMQEMEAQMRKDLEALAKENDAKHADMKRALDATHDHHIEKHAQNAQALEDGISGALDSTHKKLQEELELLKSGIDNGHGNLREVLMEVTKQVDVLDQTVQKEQKARLSVEEKLDKWCSDLKREAEVALQESHAALRMDLATQSKSSDEMKAAMMEALRVLKEELSDHKVSNEKATRELIKIEQQARGDHLDLHKKTMNEIEETLRSDLQKLVDTQERKHGDLMDALNNFDKQHHDKHGQNAAALQDGISAALSSTHQKLQEELEALKGGVEGSHGSLRDIVIEVTKQVDAMDQTLQIEHKARLDVEERLEVSCSDLRREANDSLKESHAALRIELAAQTKNADEMKVAMIDAHKALKAELDEHKADANRITIDLMSKNQQALGENQDWQKKTIGELEENLRQDLLKMADKHEKKHAELKDALDAAHNHHNDKHAQNASAIEDGIAGALDSTHKKLQEELDILKNGIDGSHGSLRDVLLEVTKQVDAIDQTMQKEQQARLAVEEALDKSCNELRREVTDILQESDAALRVELAVQSKNASEIKAALQEAHNLLKNELAEHKENTVKTTRELVGNEQQARGEHAEAHTKKMHEMEEKLRKDIHKLAAIQERKHDEFTDALHAVNTQHHDKHSKNEARLEDGIATAIKSTYQRLEQELLAVNSNNEGKHGHMREMLIEVTKQVDSIDEALQNERKERVAVEDKLEIACNQLQQRIEKSLKESHAALRMELAAHGQNSDELKAAMIEAHDALKQEFNHQITQEQKARDEAGNVHKMTMSQIEDTLRQDLQMMAETHEKSHGELRNALDATDQQHHERHVQNANALEDGLSSALAATHQKLQEEIQFLREGMAGGHGNLQEIVLEVTKQVDAIDEVLQKERESRFAAEDELRRGMTASLEESHAALHLELATQSKNSEEMKAAMLEAHSALKDELNRQNQARGEDSESHNQSVNQLEERLRNDLQILAENHDKKQEEMKKQLESWNMEHHDKHQQNAVAIEDAISAALATSHQKLEEEMQSLRGVVGGSWNLRDIMLEVTQQVDALDEIVKKEQKARLAVEQGLEMSCFELRRGMTDALQESHAALRLEVATLSNSSVEMKAAMLEAHNALKVDLDSQKADAAKSLSDIELKLRNNMQMLADQHQQDHAQLKSTVDAQHAQHSEKHLVNAAAIEDGISATIATTHQKLQNELENLKSGVESNQGSIRVSLLEVTKHVDSLNDQLLAEQKARLAVEKRLDQACQELRHDTNAALQEAHAALHMEFAAQQKNTDEMRAAMLEAHAALKTELDDQKVSTESFIAEEKSKQGAAQEARQSMKMVEEQLRNDLKRISDGHDDRHMEMRDMLQKMHDHHTDQHMQNAAALENGLANNLESTHQKLNEELSALKSGNDGKHGSLKDILVEVTKQVDALDKALQQEQKLRVAVEERLDSTCQEMRRSIEDGMKITLEGHKAEHMKATHELIAQERGYHDDKHHDHKMKMKNIEDRLRDDLRRVNDGHDSKHAEMKDILNSINDKHDEKHERNEKVFEEGIAGALNEAHEQLQKELSILKQGVDVDASNLQRILTTVTQQVDRIDTSMQDEQKLRLNVEAQLNEKEEMVNTTCEILKAELLENLKESHAALKMELAEHHLDKDDFKAAMEAAHAALQGEFLGHQGLVDSSTKDMMEKIKAVKKELSERNAQELDAVKSGFLGAHGDLQTVVTEVTRQVEALQTNFLDMRQELEEANQEAIAALKFEFAELSQEKDAMLVAMQKGQEAMNSDLERHKHEIAKDRTLRDERHGALGNRLRDMDQRLRDAYGQIIQMSDQHKAHVQELREVKAEVADDLRRVSDGHDEKRAEVRTELLEDLRNISDGHDQKHAGVREELLGIVREVSSGHDLKHAEITAELANVLEKVSGGTDEYYASVKAELMRTLEQNSGEHDQKHAKVKADLMGTMQEISDAHDQRHAKVKSEIKADLMDALQQVSSGQDQKTAETKAELMGALADVSGNNALKHAEIKAELTDMLRQVSDGHDQKHEDVKAELTEIMRQVSAGHDDKHGEMKDLLDSISRSNDEKHMQAQVALEKGLQEVLGRTRDQLAIDLAQLKSGADSKDGDFSKVFADVAAQVQSLTSALQQESGLRRETQDTFQKQCEAIERELKVAMEEAHAALRLELAENCKSNSDSQAAMKQACTALQEELKLQKDALRAHKTSTSQAHDALDAGLQGRLGDVEQRLREDLDRVAAKHNDILNEFNGKLEAHGTQIRQHLRAEFEGVQGERQDKLSDMYTKTNQVLEAGLDELVAKTHQKFAEDLANISSGVEGTHSNIREVLTEVTKEVDSLTSSLQAEKGLRQQMEEQLQNKIVELRGELQDVFNEAHAALRLELAAMCGDSKEIKAAMQDAHEALRGELMEHKARMDSSANESLDRHEDMRTRIHSEMMMIKSGLDTQHNSFRDRLAELTGQIDGLTASLHAEKTSRGDAEDRLEERCMALEHRLRQELQESMDEVNLKHREVNREMRDSLHNFNGEAHARHLKLESMVDTSVQGMAEDTDRKLQRALEELKEGVDTNISMFRSRIDQERDVREESERNIHSKIQDVTKSLTEEQEALRKNVQTRGLQSVTSNRDVEPPAWEDEIRRLWEAIDTHTHDVAVEDMEDATPTPKVARQEVSIQRPLNSLPVPALPRGPVPVTRTFSRSPGAPVASTIVPGLGGTPRVQSPAGTSLEAPPTAVGSLQRLIPAVSAPLLDRVVPAAQVLQPPTLSSLSRYQKCGNCPNMLSPDENFCEKCGWEKPVHGPLLAGTHHILHNR